MKSIIFIDEDPPTAPLVSADTTGQDSITIYNIEAKNYENGNNVGIEYVEIDGVLQDYDYDGTLGAMQGCFDFTSGTGFIIDSCIIHTCENWNHRCATEQEATNAGKSWYDELPQQMRAIDNNNMDSLEIKNCEFYELGRDACAFVSCTYVFFHHNNIGGDSTRANQGYFAVATRINGGNHFWFYNNIIHDGYFYAGEESSGPRCHADDWDHWYGTMSYMYFYNNRLYSNHHHLNLRGSAQSYNSDANNHVYYYNNVFMNMHAMDGGLLANTGCYDIYILNNLFIRFNNENSNGRIISWGISGTNCIIRNNIFYDFEESDGSPIINMSVAQTGNPTVDNNILYTVYGGRSDIVRILNDYMTWEEWQAEGYDLNGKISNPLLISVAADSICSTTNINLQATSCAIDSGYTLSQFNTDIYGTIRPQGSGWDIGPHEYIQGGSIEKQNLHLGNVTDN